MGIEQEVRDGINHQKVHNFFNLEIREEGHYKLSKDNLDEKTEKDLGLMTTRNLSPENLNKIETSTC